MAQTHVSGRRTQPGVLFSLAGRMVLDRCATVPEAVALPEELPHVRANNWLLADAEDRIAVAETSPDGVTSREGTDGFAVVTNHLHSEKSAAAEDVEARPPDGETRLWRSWPGGSTAPDRSPRWTYARSWPGTATTGRAPRRPARTTEHHPLADHAARSAQRRHRRRVALPHRVRDSPLLTQ